MKRLVLFLAFLASLSFEAWSETRYLFVLHNLGETNALMPVIDQLPEESYSILAFGKAAEKLRDHPSRIKIQQPNIAYCYNITMQQYLCQQYLHDFQRFPEKIRSE